MISVVNYIGNLHLLPKCVEDAFCFIIFSGILSTESMSMSWEIVKNTEGKLYKKGGYGLGWMIFPSKHEHGCCKNEQKVIFHTGKCKVTLLHCKLTYVFLAVINTSSGCSIVITMCSYLCKRIIAMYRTFK